MKKRTYIPKTRQVKPFTSNERIVEEMLAYAERFVKPKIILLDRGFYSSKVLNLLKSKKQNLIIPAKCAGPSKDPANHFKIGKFNP